MAARSEAHLVVLRGNSASGKSTVASSLREYMGRGVAYVEQDYVRRKILREHDRAELPNISLIDCIVRYSLDAGYHVILDGILVSWHYSNMLERLHKDYPNLVNWFYFDIPLGETQRRHALKPDTTVRAEQLAEWYHERDLLDFVDETIITVGESARDVAQRVLFESALGVAPVVDLLPERVHLDRYSRSVVSCSHGGLER